MFVTLCNVFSVLHIGRPELNQIRQMAIFPRTEKWNKIKAMIL